MRPWALAALVPLLAACGGSGSTGAYGNATLALDSAPNANDVGVYFATARGYDEAVGVTLHVQRGGPADFSIVSDAQLRAAKDLIGVMAIVQPDKLVLATSRETLRDQRDMVAATVSALQRGYLQAQLEPDEALQAMAQAVRGLDQAALSRTLDTAEASWSAGAPFIGALPKGPHLDPTVATAPDTGDQ